MSEKKEEEIVMSYIFFCPLRMEFVDTKDDCPKCDDFNDGNCPFFQETELTKKEIEKLARKRIRWI